MGWTTANVISVIVLLASILLWVGDKIYGRWQQAREERKRKVRDIIALHEHLVIILKRLKEFIDFETPVVGPIPTFRIQTLSVDNQVEICGRLFVRQPDIQTLLKTFEEHAHINYRWDDLEEAGRNIPGSQPDAKIALAQHYMQDLNNTIGAAKVIFNLTIDALSIVELQAQILKKIVFSEVASKFERFNAPRAVGQ